MSRPPPTGPWGPGAAAPASGLTDRFARARAEREAATKAYIASQRQSLASIKVGAADLAALQAEATARAAGPAQHSAKPLGRALPPAVQQVARPERVINAKLWEVDLPASIPYRLDLRAAKARLQDALKGRRKNAGEPLRGNINEVANFLIWVFETARCGYARVTHEVIAGKVGLCVDTVRRSIRFLESAGWLDTWNITKRERVASGEDEVRRTANVYLIRSAASDEPPPGERGRAGAAEAGPGYGRVAGVLARWAGFLGLEARTFGWNAPRAAAAARPP